MLASEEAVTYHWPKPIILPLKPPASDHDHSLSVCTRSLNVVGLLRNLHRSIKVGLTEAPFCVQTHRPR